jgi:hypothetical protein
MARRLSVKKMKGCVSTTEHNTQDGGPQNIRGGDVPPCPITCNRFGQHVGAYVAGYYSNSSTASVANTAMISGAKIIGKLSRI